MRVAIDEVRQLCEGILVAHGLTPEEARWVVTEYLDLELRGHRSHGLAAFSIATKQAKGRGHYEILRETDNFVLIDGHGDIGHIVGHKAIDIAVSKARSNGFCLVGIKHITRFSAPGTLVRRAAEQDLVAIITEYGGVPLMAPSGGIDPILSTNPLGIGIPSSTIPIVVDMSMSERALGFVTLAQKIGQKIDPTWALDTNGKATEDPAAVHTLLSFGGYKGYALGLALEVLTGPLLGVEAGTKGNLRDRGALFIVLDPELFGTPLLDFKAKVSGLIAEIKQARRRDGVDEILIPGEQGERRKQELLRQGFIEVEDPIIDELHKLRI
jgi:LDH2 family malate/lactate/ureidoglycolate dehydrogenase